MTTSAIPSAARRLLPMLAALALAACAAKGPPPVGEAAPPAGFLARAAALYDRAPDIAACDPGQLTAAQQAGVLAEVNALRALHGLTPVTLDPAGNQGQMEAALYVARNSRLAHGLDPALPCYTPGAAQAARTANLQGGVASPWLAFPTDAEILADFVTETRNAAGTIGHRRWLLDPFLKTIAYGRVTGALADGSFASAAALQAMQPEPASADPANPRVIAYPFHDYPARFYAPGAAFSLQLNVDPASRYYSRRVSFAEATVRVRPQGGGEPLVITDQRFDNFSTGLPNNLQFRPQGLVPGVTYEVEVFGVKVGEVKEDVTWWVRIGG